MNTPFSRHTFAQELHRPYNPAPTKVRVRMCDFQQLCWEGETLTLSMGRGSQTWVSLPGLTLASTHANAWTPLFQSSLNILRPLGARPDFSLPISSQKCGADKRGILTKRQNRLSQQRGLQVPLAILHYLLLQKLCWLVATWENPKSNLICKWFIHLGWEWEGNKEYGGG